MGGGVDAGAPGRDSFNANGGRCLSRSKAGVCGGVQFVCVTQWCLRAWACVLVNRVEYPVECPSFVSCREYVLIYPVECS